ncbi:MAG: hypothetical protein M0R17_08185 [Candidatus Omnitrophica bacterium]|jgi:hypothetical protein|nr:hypothetical protein [Candidatus Omnitrophota bacterium]
MGLLDLTVQATSRLGLEPIKNPAGGYMFEGCVPTRVIDFHTGTQKHEKGEFKEMDVPVLQIEFENFKLNLNDPDRFYTHTFKIVGTKQLVKGSSDMYEDRPKVDVEADILTLWKSIKHFLENLIGSPNYRNIVNVPKQDQIKYFDLPAEGSPKERIDAFKSFFDYLVAFVNGDGKDIKSQIVDATGKGLPMWIKMLPNYDKDSKRNAKYYAISRFINQGVFEPMKVDKDLPVGGPKIIRVKPTESLALNAAAAPAPAGYTPGGQSLPGSIDPSVAALLK